MTPMTPPDPDFATDAQVPKDEDGAYRVGDDIARRLSALDR